VKLWIFIGVLIVAGVFYARSDLNKPPPVVRTDMPFPEEQRRAATEAIQAAGFNCPEAKLAYARGQDPIGNVTRIHCGPEGGDSVYEKAVFRLTFRPNGTYVVGPWED
jgi:hypothetical protein